MIGVPAEVRDLLRWHPALRAVLLTDFLVRLAELSALVILPWWITSSGGASALAAFGVTLAVATFIAAPAASPFGDRLCKPRQITWGLVCLCLVAAAQAGLSFAGVFSLAALVVLAVLQVLASAFVDPARDAVLTELMPLAQLPAAIRLRKTTQAVSGILGPLLAGLAIGAAGVTGSLCVYGGLLALGALTASRIPRTTVVAARRNSVPAWWRDLRAGLAAKWLMPMERGWTVVNFAVWIFQGPAVGLLIPLKVQSLGAQGGWLGICLGALSTGALLGSVFGSQMLVERFGRYRVRVGLGLAEGLALAAVGLAVSPWPMVLGLVAAGFCNAAMGLVGATHRALAIPQSYRVRMFAAGAMTTQIAGAIGPALVGLALARHDIARVYTAWGLGMAACVLGLLAVPRLREFLTLGHDEIVDWYRLQYPAIFR
ncbi:MFS transporter [Roseateles sp. BYS78W]|uniref:MFS transporter n=1 Tax=Pelomonas candidula TaxID=3299025 RepID=A0ABW7H836_9BURK